MLVVQPETRIRHPIRWARANSSPTRCQDRICARASALVMKTARGRGLRRQIGEGVHHVGMGTWTVDSWASGRPCHGHLDGCECSQARTCCACSFGGKIG
jgi:hypothetical protein